MTVENVDYLEFLGSLPSESVGLVLTDPPYGIAYQNQYTTSLHRPIVGDDTKFSYAKLAIELYRVLREGTAAFIYTGWSEYGRHSQEVADAGFSLREPLICQKKASGTHDLYGSFQSNADWIMFAHKGRFRFRRTELVRNKKAGKVPAKGRQPTPEWKTRFPSCWFGSEYPWSTQNSASKVPHPTPKSVEFGRFIVAIASDVGDSVLDPFCGSGAFAVAAAIMGRVPLACEIDEEYCRYANSALEAATNEHVH